MVVAEDRVERLMVLLPTMTKLLELPDSVRTMPDDVVRGTAVLVTKLEVIVLPEASVVVMGMVVRILVDVRTAEDSEGDAESDADAGSEGEADVSDGVEEGVAEPAGVLVGSVVGSVVGAVVGAVVGSVVGSVVEGALEDCKEEVVVGSSVVEVDGAVVEVVTPVPTTCLLLGMMPAGISLALICANPAKRESMTDEERI